MISTLRVFECLKNSLADMNPDSIVTIVKLLKIIRRRHALQNLAIKALKPFINMHCFFLETTSSMYYEQV